MNKKKGGELPDYAEGKLFQTEYEVSGEEKKSDRTLERMVDFSQSTHQVPLPFGRTAEINNKITNENLTILNSDGTVELSIEITENGPKLLFKSTDIDICSSRRINIECEEFNISSKGKNSIIGASTEICSTEGSVKVRANDDVSLDGEQVRLNCDQKQTIPEWMKRELGARMQNTSSSRTMPPSDTSGDEELFKKYQNERKNK